jgi:Ribbon-helix-helix protein, copG family
MAENEGSMGVREQGRQASASPSVTRLSVNINQDAAAALKKHSERRQVSVTETVRRAIAVYDFVEEELAKGNRIQVVEKSGNVRELLFM